MYVYFKFFQSVRSAFLWSFQHNEPERGFAISQTGMKEKKQRHVLLKASTYDMRMKKKPKKDLKGITDSEFVVHLLHRELAGSRHAFSEQKQSTGFW